MSTILKLLIKLCKFIWKKLGIIGILLLVLILVIPIGIEGFDNYSNNYVFQQQWEMGAVTVEQKEKTEDITVFFSDYELDEEYGKKYVYQVQVMVTNTGVNPLCIDRSFSGIYIEDNNGRMHIDQVKQYYYEMDEYDRFDTSVIASGRTMPVCFLFVFEEDEVPNSLEFFEEYEGNSLFVVDIPAPED